MASLSPHLSKRSPQRTCVACRLVQDKRSLIRIVRSVSGILVDPTSKLSGRGAYLHANESCWSAGLGFSQKGKASRRFSPLEQALKTRLTEEEIGNLRSYIESLGEAPQVKQSVVKELTSTGPT